MPLPLVAYIILKMSYIHQLKLGQYNITMHLLLEYQIRLTIHYGSNFFTIVTDMDLNHSLQARIHNTATRKTGYQFSVVAIEYTTAKEELRYSPGIIYSVHNHPPSQSIAPIQATESWYR